MMAGKTHADLARRAMRRFEKAVIAKAARGTQPPEDWSAIDDEYGKAKRDLANYLPTAERTEEEIVKTKAALTSEKIVVDHKGGRIAVDNPFYCPTRLRQGGMV